MFEIQRGDKSHSDVPLSGAEIRGWILRLLEVGGDLGAGARIEQVAALEAVKGALCAAQVTLTVDLDDAQRGADRDRGLKQADTTRSVSGEIALARRESPRRGARHLALARALTDDLPLTFAALRRGEISERRAAMVARETACTSAQVRGQIDCRIEGELASESDARAHALVVGVTAELDAAAMAARRVRAVGARRVSVRPAPDGMAVLTAVLPCADAMAAMTALRRDAETSLDDGTGRSRAQATADLFVKRLTGRDPRDGFDVQINLVMDTSILFTGATAPAHLEGYGPIPAGLARRLAGVDATANERGVAEVAIRRLFTAPSESELVRMESSNRCFTGQLRQLIAIRDQACRTPYCDAPIRQIDHVTPHASGGATSYENAQGLCEACNYRKEHPDWRTRPDREGRITTITPSGCKYDSAPPPLPGARRSALEFSLSKRIDLNILTERIQLNYLTG